MTPSHPASTHRAVRGARDLVELWHALPAAAWRYRLAPDRPLPTATQISGALRYRAWRDHCAKGSGNLACADRSPDCRGAIEPCVADQLFPMTERNAWRMSTLSAVPWPSARVLHVVAVGKPALACKTWIEECMVQEFDLRGAVHVPISQLGNLQLPRASHWRMGIGSPWRVEKSGTQANAPVVPARPATPMEVHAQLINSMRVQAHKVSALCSPDPTMQRMLGHLSHHVSDALLARGLSVHRCGIVADHVEEVSKSNGKRYKVLRWTNGEAELEVDAEILPWLSLIALFGGGENTGKGFGRVELIPRG